MKINKSYIRTALVALVAGTLSACDFLDVVPMGNATKEDIYKTQIQTERMVVGCYGEIPDVMQPQKGFPGLMGSDEMVVGNRGTTRWFHYKSLMNGDESSSNTYFAMWSNTADKYPEDAQKKRHLGSHTQLLRRTEQHRQGSRHQRREQECMERRSSLSHRLLSPNTAGVLRTYIPGQGGICAECGKHADARAIR